jgi:L-fucose isomerase-like protein
MRVTGGGCAVKIRVGVVFLGRTRPGFDQHYGQAMNERVRSCLASMPFEIHQEPDTVADEPSLRKALAACRERGSEVLLALQTTMGDGRLAPVAAQLWDRPIVLWATPENPEGDMISSCSLVGAHNWASILRRLDRAFEIVTGHPGSPATVAELDRAIRCAASAARLRSARVGLVGSHAPGFFAMGTEPFVLSRALGVQLQSFGLEEFLDIVRGVPEGDVAHDLETVRSLGLPFKDVDEDALPMASRLYLGMRRYFDRENVDALAVRCWPELPAILGQWPYLGMTRLASEGFPIGIEGDVDGAISALAGKHLGMGPAHLTDWLEHDAETVTLWHAGNLPFCLSPAPGTPGGPRIALHFNVRKPAVVESAMRPGMPVTIVRLWQLEGMYRLAALEGETLAPRRQLMGSYGLVRLPGRDVRDVFRDLVHRGMPHHVTLFEGHHRELLRGFARLACLEWVD